MKILFTGGGTGGHIFPLVAIIREIKKREKKAKLFYIGPKEELSQTFLSREGVKVKTIVTGKLRRYFGVISFFQNFFDIFLKFPVGFFQAFFYLLFLKPDVIFSKGGYGGFPANLSAFLLKRPLFLHESDATFGLANKISAKFSSKIFVSFLTPEIKKFSPQKIIWVGNPVRKELLEGSKERAKEIFNLTGEKPLLLVLGGSQGAQRINNFLLKILPEVLKEFEIIHQTGFKNFKDFKELVEKKLFLFKDLLRYYHSFPFLDEEELKHAYKVCDLIISRAGSGTIFEISAIGKPSILIPLPESAQNHQLQNAKEYAKSGACLIFEEKNFQNPDIFLKTLKDLKNHPEKLKKMREGAKKFAKPQSAKVIAQYLLSYLTKGKIMAELN